MCEVELVTKECANPTCPRTFRVMPNDPQACCSDYCHDQAGLTTTKQRQHRGAMATDRRLVKCPTKTQKTIKKQSTPEGEKDIVKTEKKNVKDKEIVTTEKKKPSVKENIEQTTKPRSTNDKESGTMQTTKNNSTKSKPEEGAMIPRLDLQPQSMTSELAEYPSLSLIDKSANHLYESMKQLSKEDDGHLPTHRAEVMVNCARELKGMIRLKLDVFKFMNDAGAIK